MEPNRALTDGLIPPGLLEQVQALADAEHRPAHDILREAIALYREQHPGHAGAANQPSDAARRAAQEAGARIRERRRHRPMPEGMTIRDMIGFGRA